MASDGVEGFVDLQDRREARRPSPVSYPAVLSEYVKSGDVEYKHMRVTGTFDHSRERHIYAPTTASQGWHVYTLLVPEGGLPPIFVNRGWVPGGLKDPSKRAEGQVDGPRDGHRLGAPRPAQNLVLARKRLCWKPLVLARPRRHAVGPPRPAFASAIQRRKEPGLTHRSRSTPTRSLQNPGGWPKGGTTEINYRTTISSTSLHGMGSQRRCSSFSPSSPGSDLRAATAKSYNLKEE